MYTFDQLISDNNGKYVEESGSTPDQGPYRQCVDLANRFLERVRNVPKVLGTNAIDFPKKLTSPLWEWIPNNPNDDKHPGKGDIVIWKPSPGHIAICIESDLKRFSSFDQNFPTKSPCHVQEHTYENVLGWLVYKGVVAMNMYPAIAPNIDLDNIVSVKVAVDIWVRLQKGEFVDKAKYDADVKTAYNNGFGQGAVSNPTSQFPGIDMAKYTENGLNVETTIGNVKTIQNFKLK